LQHCVGWVACQLDSASSVGTERGSTAQSLNMAPEHITDALISQPPLASRSRVHPVQDHRNDLPKRWARSRPGGRVRRTPRRICPRQYINFLTCKGAWVRHTEKQRSHENRRKSPSSTTPLSFDAPTPRNPRANIRIYLNSAFKKLDSLSNIYAADSLGQSSLQRVSVACYAERCTSYSKSVRLSVCLSVTRWHCVKGKERKKGRKQRLSLTDLGLSEEIATDRQTWRSTIWGKWCHIF